MMWVRLQMISLGSLLFLNNQISTTSDTRCSRCIRMKEFINTVEKLVLRYQDILSVSKNLPSDTRTCEQAAKEMQGEPRNRALSPWKYRINREENRIPQEIAVAECLCQGCIINKSENHNYNSVPVVAPLMVLWRSPCQGQTNKYELEIIEIPVACTCAVPNIAQ